MAFWPALLRTITIETTFVPTLLPTIDESGKKSTLKGTLKNTLKDRIIRQKESIINDYRERLEQLAHAAQIVGRRNAECELEGTVVCCSIPKATHAGIGQIPVTTKRAPLV